MKLFLVFIGFGAALLPESNYFQQLLTIFCAGAAGAALNSLLSE